MLTIACCLWDEFPDTGWGEQYVKRLANSVARHLPLDHSFVVFSDRDIPGYDCRRLNPPSWRGNLPKTFVYSPEAKLEGRVILFDLDNVIVGSLMGMASYNGPFCVRGRLQKAGTKRQPDGDMISFDASSDLKAKLWDEAQRPDVESFTEGRERDFILRAVPGCDQWQDICPGHVVSYRHHCRGRLPRDARVVSCHGRPRPHQITDKFIVENWK